MPLRFLDPEGEPGHPPGKLAPRPTDLSGKVLWLLDGQGNSEQGKPVMNRVFRAWKERLEQEYRFSQVNYLRTDNIASPFRHGKDKFEEIVRAGGVIINGVAQGGVATSTVVHDAVQYERRGVPTVTLAHDNFGSAAKALARVMGLPDLPLAVVSQDIYSRGTPEQVRDAADTLYPQVVQALTQPPKLARV